MDIASEVVELFTTRDPARARELALKLDQLNTDRRAAEAAVLTQIDAMLAAGTIDQLGCLVIDGDGWHRGVLGILASRVVERTGRPALVLSHEDGEAHGSGRSIPGFHLLEALESCHDVFVRFGGHAHAVGFSLTSARVPELRERLQQHAAVRLHTADPRAQTRLQRRAATPPDRHVVLSGTPPARTLRHGQRRASFYRAQPRRRRTAADHEGRAHPHARS